jgi:hypothetical protein
MCTGVYMFPKPQYFSEHRNRCIIQKEACARGVTRTSSRRERSIEATRDNEMWRVMGSTTVKEVILHASARTSSSMYIRNVPHSVAMLYMIGRGVGRNQWREGSGGRAGEKGSDSRGGREEEHRRQGVRALASHIHNGMLAKTG